MTYMEGHDMNTTTIALEVKTFRTPAPAHAGKSPCLCDDCWADYLHWRERHDA